MGLSARVLGRCKALTPRQPLRYPRRPHGAPGLQLMLASSPALLRRLSRDIELRPDFLSPAEEAALLRELELEPRLKRQRYQRDHWDQAIHGYREIEKSQWTEQNTAVLQRLRDVAFLPGVPQLSMVHVLDLEKTGFINPHVDSVKFCGDTIAGMCLLSSSVMRLVSEDSSEDWVDLLLQRRSAYVLRGAARYQFSHQILRDEESFFGSRKVPRDRRISIICRNLPISSESADHPSYTHGTVQYIPQYSPELSMARIGLIFQLNKNPSYYRKDTGMDRRLADRQEAKQWIYTGPCGRLKTTQMRPLLIIVGNLTSKDMYCIESTGIIIGGAKD
ncbi:alpha-ketoglutarate-dependent dioxygenase alkB homolog 7, mitochondrial isoform X2 [Mobula birostris]|uniref:alpha-ketoglutarate-dependent dioxygenase alkB homolog 7, mitochondrial isoform X2 n=1 Tax=Mobula birostris TaxID=1983395 RepID=UPI003B287541